MHIQQNDIEEYLAEIKTLINSGAYRIERNSKREDNLDLFLTYILDEPQAKEILLNLTPQDFSAVVQNEHIGYEHEQLYIFGKDVLLTERYSGKDTLVSLYIKINKLETPFPFVIVISFHKQNFPLTYYFK